MLSLLAAWQANKSEAKLLGQGIRLLIQNPADQENGRLLSQRTISPQSEFQLLLYEEGEGEWLAVADILVQKSFVLIAVHIGQVTMFL